MHTNQSHAPNPNHPSVEQIADMLSVVIWANHLMVDEVDAMASSCKRPALRTVSRLESLLVSLRPVADARAGLTQMDGELLLAGFEMWAGRQRAVMQRLAAAETESL